jgi:hypothetical protein
MSKWPKFLFDCHLHLKYDPRQDRRVMIKFIILFFFVLH